MSFKIFCDYASNCGTNPYFYIVFNSGTNIDMRGTYLGEFQELVLLAIMLLDKDAYGASILEKINEHAGRWITRGALHSALTRLEEKGYIQSAMGGATAERGGRRKRLYTITPDGRSVLEEAKGIRDAFWAAIPQTTQGN